MAELAQFRLDQLSRPAVQPVQAVQVLRSGVDRFRVGDSWAFLRTDLLHGGQQTRRRGEVTAIEGGRVMVNGGEMVMDQMGGVLVNRFGVKDPAQVVAPADLQVGKRWRSAFTNRRDQGPASRNYYDNRVVALEELQLPAGRYKAFKVDARGEAIQPRAAQKLHVVSWFDPATMLLVRLETRHTAYNGAEVYEDSRLELLWRKLVPRS
jgi:hypothetical protein